MRSGLYVFPKLFAWIKLIYPDLPLSRTDALLHTVTDSMLSHARARARAGARTRSGSISRLREIRINIILLPHQYSVFVPPPRYGSAQRYLWNPDYPIPEILTDTSTDTVS
jgi:hypothetical protein